MNWPPLVAFGLWGSEQIYTVHQCTSCFFFFCLLKTLPSLFIFLKKQVYHHHRHDEPFNSTTVDRCSDRVEDRDLAVSRAVGPGLFLSRLARRKSGRVSRNEAFRWKEGCLDLEDHLKRRWTLIERDQRPLVKFRAYVNFYVLGLYFWPAGNLTQP